MIRQKEPGLIWGHEIGMCRSGSAMGDGDSMHPERCDMETRLL